MKTNRKKMLLSSIAMLLVALVALGSATYAWFTINKEVTADQMTVAAATATGLQITNKNGNSWARDVHFSDSGIILKPTSRGFTSSSFEANGFYPKDVDSENGSGARAWDNSKGATNYAKNWAQDAGRPIVPAGDVVAKSNNDYYSEYRVGIRSSDQTKTVSGVKMNINYTDSSASGKSAAGFIRVVVLEEGDNDSETIKAYIADGGASTSAVTAITGTEGEKTPSTVQDQANTSNTDIAIGNVSTAKYYRIVVWFEGQDADCTDTNQSATGSINVKFFF